MYVLTTYIPLLAHAQSIEAAAKDMAACHAIGRDERTVSAIATLRSVFCTMTKEHADSDADFLNRKRTNEDANACYPGKIFNKTFLILCALSSPILSTKMSMIVTKVHC